MPITDPLPVDGQTPWGDTFRDWADDVVVSVHTLEAEPDPTPPDWVRLTASHTTIALAAGAQELSTVTMTQSYDVFQVSVDMAARVRLYRTAAQRNADAARPVGTLPTETGPEHGCFLEAIFTAAGSFTVTAGGRGFVDSGNMIPLAVENRSAGLGMVVVTFTYLPLETP